MVFDIYYKQTIMSSARSLLNIDFCTLSSAPLPLPQSPLSPPFSLLYSFSSLLTPFPLLFSPFSTFLCSISFLLTPISSLCSSPSSLFSSFPRKWCRFCTICCACKCIHLFGHIQCAEGKFTHFSKVNNFKTASNVLQNSTHPILRHNNFLPVNITDLSHRSMICWAKMWILSHFYWVDFDIHWCSMQFQIGPKRPQGLGFGANNNFLS